MAKSSAPPFAVTGVLTAAARRLPERKPRRSLHDLKRKEIDALESLFQEDYPESVLEVARVLFVELLNQDTPRLELDQAAQVARAQAEAVRKELGGLKLYFTRGTRMDANIRRRQILAEYTGDNASALARKHGLSHERVRSILREEGHYASGRRTAKKDARREQIAAEYTGNNIDALALKYGVTSRYVKDAIRDALTERRPG